MYWIEEDGERSSQVRPLLEGKIWTLNGNDDDKKKQRSRMSQDTSHGQHRNRLIQRDVTASIEIYFSFLVSSLISLTVLMSMFN